MTIAEFKSIRLRNHLSLSEMANVLGISKSHAFRIETGRKTLTENISQRVEDIFMGKKKPENKVRWHGYPSEKPRLRAGCRFLVWTNENRTELYDYNFYSAKEQWEDVVAWAELPRME